jgi:hypothetical protein
MKKSAAAEFRTDAELLSTNTSNFEVVLSESQINNRGFPASCGKPPR